MNAMYNERRKYELKARAAAQRQTRERIVHATMELHREVGPARTTVAEIARRAGVQRLTVYNHFPDEAELFGACQARWLGLTPFPTSQPPSRSISPPTASTPSCSVTTAGTGRRRPWPSGSNATEVRFPLSTT